MTATGGLAHHWSNGDLLQGRAVVLRADDGTQHRPPVERWLGPVTAEEWSVLDRAVGPVLDVGCGPGRHVVGLVRSGIPALGIDVAGQPLRVARRRGAPVLQASVFDPLPGEGTWATALLLDGSIGIGGAPTRLLTRLATVLRADGRVLLELDAPGLGAVRSRVCVHAGAGTEREGPTEPRWFPWARVSADVIDRVAAPARLVPVEIWEEAARWFAHLAKR